MKLDSQAWKTGELVNGIIHIIHITNLTILLYKAVMSHGIKWHL